MVGTNKNFENPYVIDPSKGKDVSLLSAERHVGRSVDWQGVVGSSSSSSNVLVRLVASARVGVAGGQ